MKIFTLSTVLCFFVSSLFQLHAQVDIQPNAVGINVMGPVSDLGVNTVGDNASTVYIKGTRDVQSSAALRIEPYNVQAGFGSFAMGLQAFAEFPDAPNRIVTLMGSAYRDAPYNNGRSTGVSGQAGNSTPGANYGGFFRLGGSNTGAAVLGYDEVGTFVGWGQVLNPTVSYAGFFFGKGYFRNEVGIGYNDDPQELLHVSGGNVYIQDAANGIIMNSPGGTCYLLTLDNAGDFVKTALGSCP